MGVPHMKEQVKANQRQPQQPSLRTWRQELCQELHDVVGAPSGSHCCLLIHARREIHLHMHSKRRSAEKDLHYMSEIDKDLCASRSSQVVALIRRSRYPNIFSFSPKIGYVNSGRKA